MSAIVSGFPSKIAALQFEWAWQNPHFTRHISPNSRISKSAGRKKSGRPRRPRHTLDSTLSNLHLLLRVKSFARWPLSIHFFADDVHKYWVKVVNGTPRGLPDSLRIFVDLPNQILDPNAIVEQEEVDPFEAPPSAQLPSSQRDEKGKVQALTVHGIERLAIDYKSCKPQLEKSKEVFDFEQEGSCAVCLEELEHDSGVYTICASKSCRAVSHLTCLSKHFLKTSGQRLDEGEECADDDHIVPISGCCPVCDQEMRWIDVIKELSLRMRGRKVVEKLLKKPRVKAEKKPTKKRKDKDGIEIPISATQETVGPPDDEDEDDDDDDTDDEAFEVFVQGNGYVSEEKGGRVYSDTDNADDAVSVNSCASSSRSVKEPAKKGMRKAKLATVVEDSDLDSTIELD